MTTKTTKKKKQPISRMNLEMSLKVRKRLEELSEETDCSLTETIRRALSVYDLLLTQQKSGAEVLVRDEDGERQVLIY